jgi:type III pantothenate kinase
MSLLAIDIGNTNIGLAVFSSNHLIIRFFIPTQTKKYSLMLNKLSSRKDITTAIICSVVPKATSLLEKDIKKILNIKPYVLGRDIKVSIKNLYQKPQQVGQDRLVNAHAGSILYGAPLIIIDFGTAVTFDIVSKKKEYLGGMILPGLQISLDALGERTALLPKIKLAKPNNLIGKDTKSSMLSGIVYGFAALSDNLVRQIKKKTGKDTKVIGTGGDISLIARYCQGIDKIDEDLTLKGLNFIYNTL